MERRPTASAPTSVMYDDTEVGVGGLVLRGFGGHGDDRGLGRVLAGGGGLLCRKEKKKQEQGVRKHGPTGVRGYRLHRQRREQLRMLAPGSNFPAGFRNSSGFIRVGFKFPLDGLCSYTTRCVVGFLMPFIICGRKSDE